MGFTALLSCSDNAIYDKYHEIDGAKWSADSIVNFDFNLKDSISKNQIYIKIRNTVDYPFSNLYLFTKVYFPDGNIIVDTLEYEMTDAMGNWLGDGIGGLKNNYLYFKKDVVFSKVGSYRISVQHGMRVNELLGIQDVGLSIENNQTK